MRALLTILLLHTLLLQLGQALLSPRRLDHFDFASHLLRNDLIVNALLRHCHRLRDGLRWLGGVLNAVRVRLIFLDQLIIVNQQQYLLLPMMSDMMTAQINLKLLGRRFRLNNGRLLLILMLLATLAGHVCLGDVFNGFFRIDERQRAVIAAEAVAISRARGRRALTMTCMLHFAFAFLCHHIAFLLHHLVVVVLGMGGLCLDKVGLLWFLRCRPLPDQILL